MYACVWLDKNVEKGQIQQKLRYVIRHLHIFEDSGACDNYIRASTKERLVLIMSDAFTESIIARLHDLSQLIYCYIICREDANNTIWTNQYQKIKGVFHHEDEVLSRIIQDKAVHKKLEDNISISFMPNESQSLQSRNANFLWFLLYIEVLFRMHHPEIAKDELVEVCKSLYADQPDALLDIDEFQCEYTSDKAIWWYTRDTCFYRIVNSALRSRDYDMLYAIRFFIADIATDIRRAHEKFIGIDETRIPFVVYRGQFVSNNELQLMLDNVGEFFSMNSFLSTSRKCETALSFLQHSVTDSNNRCVLFEITIDPRLPTKAYADIKEHSVFPTEDEVLIIFGALFHIDSILENSKETLHIVKVSLANDDDYRLKEIFNYMKKTIGNECTLDSLGKILQEMGEYQYAKKYYERMMRETRITLATGHMGLGKAMYAIMSYENALEHYQISLALYEKELGKDHYLVGISHNRVGAALCRQGEMNKSLIHLQKAKEIQERARSPNYLELAETYNSLGLAYFTLNQLEEAATYFQKVLDIRMKVLPAGHPAIGFAYNNLGRVFENGQKYGQAIEYFKKALDISEKTLPPGHTDVERIQENIRQMKLQAVKEAPPMTQYEHDCQLVISFGMN